MANLKVVIGTDHVGTQYADELIDSFPDIDFVVAYEVDEHVEAIRDADAFFGSAEVAMWMADRATRWPSARKGGARSSASDAMAQASIGSGVRPRCPRSSLPSLR